MNETMGQIIRRLRKERKLTQEELAELLGVTFQAVSKWENDIGMPDISQVVPLATVFDVSTDVLFGVYGQYDEKQIRELIERANSLVTRPATKEKVKACYDELQKGLKKYPNDPMLLCQCLEKGIALAYPENDTYDAEHGAEIYLECVREANLIIKYDSNTTSVLRAHMIMALLHAAYGNIEKAEIHANKFPWRADMTLHTMSAFIAHLEKDYKAENDHHQVNLFMQMEAMIDTFVGMGCCYNNMNQYAEASDAFRKALELIAMVCNHEPALQRLHRRERGDIYVLLAESCLIQGDREEALTSLEEMVAHDMLGKVSKSGNEQTPMWLREMILEKLNRPAFAVLKNEERYVNLFTALEQ